MVRCSDELREALEQLANQDRRTMANYIRIVLEDHVRDRTNDGPSKRKRAA
jgi:predicted DNA-binding protein